MEPDWNAKIRFIQSCLLTKDEQTTPFCEEESDN